MERRRTRIHFSDVCFERAERDDRLSWLLCVTLHTKPELVAVVLLRQCKRDLFVNDNRCTGGLVGETACIGHDGLGTGAAHVDHERVVGVARCADTRTRRRLRAFIDTRKRVPRHAIGDLGCRIGGTRCLAR